jgi:hypothetical protein
MLPGLLTCPQCARTEALPPWGQKLHSEPLTPEVLSSERTESGDTLPTFKLRPFLPECDFGQVGPETPLRNLTAALTQLPSEITQDHVFTAPFGD